MGRRTPFKAISPFLIMIAISMLVTAPAAAESPGSYCASRANDDRVRPIPDEFVGPAIRLFELQTEDAKWAKASTVYRCMSGSVWLCNHGANLPCAKADARRTIPAVSAFCRENPNEEFVPMVVTGHGVNHSWECVHGKARVKETEELDERGFVSNQWKRLAP